MTENEAINVLELNRPFGGNVFTNELQDAIDVAIQALEEIQKYRAIGLTPELIEAMQGHNIALINDLGEYQQTGTIEEIRALKKKAEPKKSKEVHQNEVCIDFICPNCKEAVYGQPYKPNYCKHCGQKLDWSE